MSDFTAGPWEWRDGFLCQVNGGRLGFTYDYNKGNRRLIAAAPDMLAALEATMEALGGLYGAEHGEQLPIETLTQDRQELFHKTLDLVGVALDKVLNR